MKWSSKELFLIDGVQLYSYTLLAKVNEDRTFLAITRVQTTKHS